LHTFRGDKESIVDRTERLKGTKREEILQRKGKNYFGSVIKEKSVDF